jgi:aldehyde:ferredoxin oxidoreductase
MPTRAAFDADQAAIMNDDQRSLARGGTGAAMGSENLKAIIVVRRYPDSARFHLANSASVFS